MYIHRWLTCGRDWNDRRGCVCGPMLWAGEFVCSASRRHQCRLESWRQCCQTSENTKNILHHPKWVTVVAFSWGCGETGVLVVPAVAPIHSLVPPPSARKHITLKFRVFFGLSCLKLAEAIMRNEAPKLLAAGTRVAVRFIGRSFDYLIRSKIQSLHGSCFVWFLCNFWFSSLLLLNSPLLVNIPVFSLTAFCNTYPTFLEPLLYGVKCSSVGISSARRSWPRHSPCWCWCRQTEGGCRWSAKVTWNPTRLARPGLHSVCFALGVKFA